ncbi:MAG: SpoVR family protein [Candidatus Spechtbacterales bacterium]
MNREEIERLKTIEKRVHEIAQENGLITTEIIFELVPPKRMIEAMAYGFPTNFSHWSRGRDFERQRTIYDHTGAGIPYEVVWNFDTPRAFLVDTNPFALNVVILCHVYGHVDFFLGSRYLNRGREIADMAREARNAAKRFQEYEKIYGVDAVEQMIDAAMTIQWIQDPDPFAEDLDEEAVREDLMERERAKLERAKGGLSSEFNLKNYTDKELISINSRLKRLKYRTPPVPTHDVLKYITDHSPKPLRDWERDVLQVVRHQARYLAPQRRTKLLNEGWATYWHTKIIRQLFEEGLLTEREHGVFNQYNSAVLAENKKSMNWYRIGVAMYGYVEDRWNKGQFGIEYEDSNDPRKHLTWDMGAMKGREKLFEIRTAYSDRMAIEEFFTDEFIREQELYIWEQVYWNGEYVDVIVEDRPEVIRQQLKNFHGLYNSPLVTVEDGNYKRRGELYLKHHFTGFELDPRFESGTLEHIYRMWSKPVHLETVEILDEKEVEVKPKHGKSEVVVMRNMRVIVHSYDGKNHTEKEKTVEDSDD